MRTTATFLVLFVTALLLLPAQAAAQTCIVSGATGAFCDPEGADCSPPDGGTCVQHYDANGAPDFCRCEVVEEQTPADKPAETGQPPAGAVPGGGGGGTDDCRVNIYLIIVIIILIVIVVILWIKCRKHH